tara:strand:- start:82 stop:216 length:135 start_codon:yes stop_codon:yes gene_type:complete
MAVETMMDPQATFTAPTLGMTLQSLMAVWTVGKKPTHARLIALD